MMYWYLVGIESAVGTKSVFGLSTDKVNLDVGIESAVGIWS